MRSAVFITLFSSLIFACSSESGGILDFKNANIDSSGMVAYVSYTSNCPNCLRSKSALLEAASMHSDFKWHALYIDDEDTASLPSAIFKKHLLSAKPIASKLGLNVTPEVVLMNSGKVIYRGAITDQNKKLTQGRLRAQVNYLNQACMAATNNLDTTLPAQKAVGCFIEYDL